MDRRTRKAYEKHGRALESALAKRMQQKALGSGRPWKHKKDRDFHTGLKRFLLRIIATISEIGR